MFGLRLKLFDRPDALPRGSDGSGLGHHLFTQGSLAILLVLPPACGHGRMAPLSSPQEAAMPPHAPAAADQPVTLTGIRVTEGNAVDCPQIETADGRRHGVSYLSPAVAIGARVTVSGHYGVTTTCLGRVLIVAEERPEK